MGNTPRAAGWLGVAAGLCGCALPAVAHAQSIEELRDMPISSLASLDVTSVTKSPAALADAPASIYVITHDDIVRSGSLTLATILRLAPNLQVLRGSATDVSISARGMGGNKDAQSFPNKLLVMIDGRNVYSPLYGGVYWDMQDVLPEDVERIEVISGPGATMWGANAFNGVINIITRNAGTTQGLYGTLVGGNRTYDLGLRYGGSLGENANFRLFVKRHQNFDSAKTANDDAKRTQGGFRIDWSLSAIDTLMVQGDLYRGSRSRGVSPDENTRGQDVVLRWERVSPSGSSLRVQTYYDHAGRQVEKGGDGFRVDTFDGDIQYGLAPIGPHEIAVGAGARIIRYDIDTVGDLRFVPGRRTLKMGNVFVQDSIHLGPALTAIVGLKLEDAAFVDPMLLPSLRLSWKPREATLFWGAISRAVRSPTPFDNDVAERLDGIDFIAGSSRFRSEKLTAYEAGTRLILSQQASVSVSAFYNDYDDLRSLEPSPGTIVPLVWANGIKGYSYGFDAWGDVRLADWWRIKPGYSLLIDKFAFKPGASGALGLSQVTNDPEHRASLRSSMDIGSQINVDADLRYVSSLPNPYLKGYVELGMRLGWQFDERAEVSVSGFNMLHKRHREVPATQGRAIRRSFFAALKWTI